MGWHCRVFDFQIKLFAHSAHSASLRLCVKNKMKSPLFSCVVPVKGARPYLAEALSSLKAQGLGDDLEIIVQDADVEPDVGQSDALNKGFAKAKGEWLFWLNADDVLLPGALKKVLDRINRIDRIDWIAGNQLLIDDAGKVLKCSVGNGWHDWLYRHAVPHVYGPSSFFRRELLERVGGLDVSLKYCMDWDLWIKFMKAGARFERIDEYLWAQRQWLGSKTQRKMSQQENVLFWGEINEMLNRNGVAVTRTGTLMMRIWRFFNGNIPRQFFDGIRFADKEWKSLYA